MIGRSPSSPPGPLVDAQRPPPLPSGTEGAAHPERSRPPHRMPVGLALRAPLGPDGERPAEAPPLDPRAHRARRDRALPDDVLPLLADRAARDRVQRALRRAR